jgi:hypothetical protein
LTPLLRYPFRPSYLVLIVFTLLESISFKGLTPTAVQQPRRRDTHTFCLGFYCKPPSPCPVIVPRQPLRDCIRFTDIGAGLKSLTRTVHFYRPYPHESVRHSTSELRKLLPAQSGCVSVRFYSLDMLAFSFETNLTSQLNLPTLRLNCSTCREKLCICFPMFDAYHLLLPPTTWRLEPSLWPQFPVKSRPDDRAYSSGFSATSPRPLAANFR